MVHIEDDVLDGLAVIVGGNERLTGDASRTELGRRLEQELCVMGWDGKRGKGRFGEYLSTSYFVPR